MPVSMHLLWFTVLLWILGQEGPINSGKNPFIIATHAKPYWWARPAQPFLKVRNIYYRRDSPCFMYMRNKIWIIIPNWEMSGCAWHFGETCFNGNDITQCLMNDTWFKLAPKKGQEQWVHPYLFFLFNCQRDLNVMDDWSSCTSGVSIC